MNQNDNQDKVAEPMPSVEPQAAPPVEEPVVETPIQSVSVPTPPDPASAMTETPSEEEDSGQNG